MDHAVPHLVEPIRTRALAPSFDLRWEIRVFMAAHVDGAFVRASTGLRFVGDRPLVYMAKGSHASYPTPGSWFSGLDSTSDSGPQWDTSRLLRPLATQPWRDYAGAWGEIGAIGTTTGPLGPWHKRNNS